MPACDVLLADPVVENKDNWEPLEISPVSSTTHQWCLYCTADYKPCTKNQRPFGSGRRMAAFRQGLSSNPHEKVGKYSAKSINIAGWEFQFPPILFLGESLDFPQPVQNPKKMSWMSPISR